MNNEESLGQKVRRLRLERGLTQRDLAEKLSVDFSYLSKIENDRLEHTPSLKTLQGLAQALGGDELEMLRLADKMPPLLRELAGSPEAMRFLRKAGRSVRSEQTWRSLSEHLDALEEAPPSSPEGSATPGDERPQEPEAPPLLPGRTGRRSKR